MDPRRPNYRFSPNPHTSRNSKRAEKAIAQGGKPDGTIRVRLDHRTIITLKSTKALDFWRERYPKAQVIP